MVSIKKLLDQWKFDPKILLNKYIIAFVFFLIWMIFFDYHKIKGQIKLSRTVDHLLDEKELYRQQILQIKADREDIENNTEKYAREKYYMHMPDEEVWIVPDQQNDKENEK